MYQIVMLHEFRVLPSARQIVFWTSADFALAYTWAKSRNTFALCGNMAKAKARHRSIKSTGQCSDRFDNSSGGVSYRR